MSLSVTKPVHGVPEKLNGCREGIGVDYLTIAPFSIGPLLDADYTLLPEVSHYFDVPSELLI